MDSHRQPQPGAEPTAAGRRLAALAPLSSLRYLAALHLFAFHLQAAGRMQRGDASAPPVLIVTESWPIWMRTLIERGYCSTSLFFLLSGLVLTYLYVDERGEQTIGNRAFWWARFTRLYPLHCAVLWLIAPLAIWFALQHPHPTWLGLEIPRPVWLLIGYLLSATLTQAWFPEFALSWNFPTWALSTVVFFYAVFPWLTGRLRALGTRGWTTLVVVCPLVSLIPPVLYLMVAGEDRQMTFDETDFGKQFWNEFVMRTPLFWLPHFLLGMALARRWQLTRHGPPAAAPTGVQRWLSWGDVSAAMLLAILVVPDASLAAALGLPAYAFRLILRHGALAPLYVVLVLDLARGRGLLVRLLSTSWLARLGDASFSLFILQLPLMIVGAGLSSVSRLPPSIAWIGLLAFTTLVALGSAALEQRLTRRLRLG